MLFLLKNNWLEKYSGTNWLNRKKNPCWAFRSSPRKSWKVSHRHCAFVGQRASHFTVLGWGSAVHSAVHCPSPSNPKPFPPPFPLSSCMTSSISKVSNCYALLMAHSFLSFSCLSPWYLWSSQWREGSSWGSAFLFHLPNGLLSHYTLLGPQIPG